MTPYPRMEWRATRQASESLTRAAAAHLLWAARGLVRKDSAARIRIIAPHVYQVGSVAVPEYFTIATREVQVAYAHA